MRSAETAAGLHSVSALFRVRPALGRLLAFLAFFSVEAALADFNQPWREKRYALVLDAYELNALEWNRIVTDKRIAGFIGKASDGLSPEYCADRTSMCGVQWRKYAVTRELYHTRKMLAKALGLKWGSYHLGRAGNPELQALHYIQFAQPEADEVIVLDIESLDDSKFMSLTEAERFAKYINKRLGRFPMLYTNHQTASYIAANRAEFPLLSRLKLWYARYKPEIGGVFPMGNWDSYALWQFAYGGNCGKKSCPYRVPGTPDNIDVNVAPMSIAELREAWPFDGLLEEKPLPADTTPDEILMANTVVDPEEEKHSDFVIDVDYNPRNTPPGAVLTSPGSELAAGDGKASVTTDRLKTASAAKPEGPQPKCRIDEKETVESDDLENC